MHYFWLPAFPSNIDGGFFNEWTISARVFIVGKKRVAEQVLAVLEHFTLVLEKAFEAQQNLYSAISNKVLLSSRKELGSDSRVV